MKRTHQTQRHSVRLEMHDYSSSGAYFVTICTQMRDTNWFGAVARDGMKLNDAGVMIERELKNLITRFSSLEIDTHIIMPDHIHVIFVLRDDENDEFNPKNRRGEPRVRPATPRKPADTSGATVVDRLRIAQGDDKRPCPKVRFMVKKHRPYENPRGTQSGSIGRIVQTFKSLTTRQYIQGVRESGWPVFEKRFWQRDYWERVLRDDAELGQKREYIMSNPARWLDNRGSA
jgi:putative transposase